MQIGLKLITLQGFFFVVAIIFSPTVPTPASHTHAWIRILCVTYSNHGMWKMNEYGMCDIFRFNTINLLIPYVKGVTMRAISVILLNKSL